MFSLQKQGAASVLDMAIDGQRLYRQVLADVLNFVLDPGGYPLREALRHSVGCVILLEFAASQLKV